MKIITSMGILTTAEGKRLSITFSTVDNSGKIIEENQRVNRVVLDESALNHISALEDFALSIVGGE